MTNTSSLARETFALWQKCALGLLLLAGVAALLTIGTQALILPLFFYVFLTFILCIHILYLVLLSSLRSVDRRSMIDLVSKNEADAPLYTVLVPLYQEAQILPKLIENLLKLDYPTDRLEIILLLEEDDEETHAALEDLQLPSHFQRIIVPVEMPRTKARACNIGLDEANGKYLVIYDAEDRPEPDQLWKAITAFQQSDDRVACVQSRLSFYNSHQNLLTKLFTLEYTFWYDLFLPALSIIGAPIPLGGSSNHLRTSILKKIGRWDAYNVTEDCDLGIRLVKEGYRTIIINSTTWEEANSQIGNWIRQRSRWIKGYLQTYLVHTRDLINLRRQLGWQNFLFFQLYIGGMPLLLLLAPLFWMLTLIWTVWQGQLVSWYFPPILYLLSLASIVLSVLALLSCGLSSAVARRNYDLIKDLLWFPFYFLFFYIAAWKGGYQLFTRPHYWEKTKHGLE